MPSAAHAWRHIRTHQAGRRTRVSPTTDAPTPDPITSRVPLSPPGPRFFSFWAAGLWLEDVRTAAPCSVLPSGPPPYLSPPISPSPHLSLSPFYPSPYLPILLSPLSFSLFPSLSLPLSLPLSTPHASIHPPAVLCQKAEAPAQFAVAAAALRALRRGRRSRCGVWVI